MKKFYFLKTFVIMVVLILLFSNAYAGNKYCISLDDIEQFWVNDDAANHLDITGSYTIECWINVDNYQEYDRIFDRRTVFAMSTIAPNGSGDFAIRFTERDGSHNILRTIETDASHDLYEDTWYHVAVTFDNSTGIIKLYINGDEVATQTNSYWSLSASTNALNIGGLYNSGYYNQIDALIDEVRISNIARDKSDLQTDKSSEEYSSDANTVLLMHLDDKGAPPTYVSGTGLTGTTGDDDITAIDYIEVTNRLLQPEYRTKISGYWANTSTWEFYDGATSSWDNATLSPDSADNTITILDGHTVTVNCDTTTNETIINEGGTLIINSGHNLKISPNTNGGLSITGEVTVDGTLTLNSGSNLVINSSSTITGSLIINGTLTNNGTITIQRYIAGWGTGNLHGWHLISSPVANQNISTEFVDVTATPISSDVDFYRWSETENKWINIKNDAGNYNQGSASTNFSNDASPQFAEGSGYLIAYSSNQTKTFTGTPNTSNVSVSSLSKDHDGWHLLGNPFPSALYWNKTTADWNLSDIDATAKIWKESTASYIDIKNGGTHEIIPAMQGFMVQATSAGASLTIPASDRTHSTQAWYKNAATVTNTITLTAHDTENNTAQESIIKIDKNSTAGFDTQYDSHFLAGFAPLFYSVLEDGEGVSTNTLPNLTDETEIPFVFVKNSSNNFYITAEGIETLTPSENVYLKDLKTGHTQLLNDNPRYDFSSQEGDDPNRFVLLFAPVGIKDNVAVQPFNIYNSGSKVFIISDNDKNATVNIYNVSGQLIKTVETGGNHKTEINLENHKGLFIISVTNGNYTQNQKVILN